MADIFISYKKERRTHAERLSSVLEAYGFEVWWDHELSIGGSFREEIQEELDKAKAVIVLWCRKAVKSNFVRSEANRADKQEKLLQVFLESVDAPIGFDEAHSLNLEDWEGSPRDDRIYQLVEFISKLVGRPEKHHPNLIRSLAQLEPLSNNTQAGAIAEGPLSIKREVWSQLKASGDFKRMRAWLESIDPTLRPLCEVELEALEKVAREKLDAARREAAISAAKDRALRFIQKHLRKKSSCVTTDIVRRAVEIGNDGSDDEYLVIYFPEGNFSITEAAKQELEAINLRDNSEGNAWRMRYIIDKVRAPGIRVSDTGEVILKPKVDATIEEF